MLDLLVQRSTVVALAVIGGVLSLVVTALSARGALSATVIKRLNMASYVFMGSSMLLFIVAGLS
jgi:hypothetical protein